MKRFLIVYRFSPKISRRTPSAADAAIGARSSAESVGWSRRATHLHTNPSASAWRYICECRVRPLTEIRLSVFHTCVVQCAEYMKLNGNANQGLENLVFESMGLCPKSSVVSDGTEVILLNAKFFAQHLTFESWKTLLSTVSNAGRAYVDVYSLKYIYVLFLFRLYYIQQRHAITV